MPTHFEDPAAKDRAYSALFRELLPALDRAAAESTAYDLVVDALHRLPHFDWTGIYLLAEPTVLVLGPFRGAPTEHARIVVGTGVCGQSAARDETVLVEDVREESNYLACSLDTRSEIVIPIRVRGAYRAQIDVDSHIPAAFDVVDRGRLEELASRLGERIETLEAEGHAR